ncbi:hypothetical protein S7711_08601 [Stachybotrys chartarum IBT 7711]|uniref:Pre-rRNA-processing protein IPI3 n=1 Tax=Stachybotrys chartarum (strain CBS 109288 / IBT 7711) TaxID=1280523 RepID=A0A084AWY8_STACB|nr:hypothetical protein S7711_08601 [Stachybotrys chartarum IBT 7711]
MLSEEFFSSICGPPLAANTAVSKDIGIYAHTLTPSYSVKSTFKKSSTPPNCLAVNDTHAFAAQDQKAHVHVYSRLRGNQEALISFPERIRSLALAGDVLVLGTAEGRLILWEVCTGRQVTTPPCHVQAVTCLATTPFHILSASEDSNISVWSLAALLELDAQAEHEPERTLSNHRSAVTGLDVGPSTNPETAICVSCSKDKTCIIWNYRTGDVLRTLLFPTIPLCASLDPSARALLVSTQDGSVHLMELFGDKPLVGSRSLELASIVVQVNSPLGTADEDAGPASCMAFGYDGTSIVTGHTKGRILRWNLGDGGHPTELANLNAAVTNVVFVPLLPQKKLTRALNVVKPSQSLRQYAFTSQLEGDIAPQTTLSKMLATPGFPAEAIERAWLSMDSKPISAEAQIQAEDSKLQGVVKEMLPRPLIGINS